MSPRGSGLLKLDESYMKWFLDTDRFNPKNSIFNFADGGFIYR